MPPLRQPIRCRRDRDVVHRGRLMGKPRLGPVRGERGNPELFRGASEIFSFAIHYSLNGHIEMRGDTARARWYLFMPCTIAAENRAMWRAASITRLTHGSMKPGCSAASGRSR